ncbi:MAG TPA: hypothetical protein VGN84_02145 [Solirubrobacterales bacterium]|nr:hypothetical protein [Solirubrobacterales bacterium]
MFVLALASLALAGSASAKLTGNYTRFAQCPFKNPETLKCLHSVTESGEVVLGNKKVPIENPVVLQGGYTAPVEGFSTFIPPTNGITLSKAPQNVPGGLAGLVNCKEISNFILKAACEWTFENGLTGVSSTLELARPASEIRVGENNIAGEEGVGLKMPVKVHLENPLLGESCYVGSSSSPIIWELTSATTNPPAPNKPIKGGGGSGEFLEEGRIVVLKGTSLVDNAWSAPGASGCGGLFSFLLDPIIDASVGVPAAAGHNTAILVNTISLSTAFAVNKNDEENP